MSELHRISGCDNAARKADVIFIHGLGGDAFATWRYGKDNSSSWPHALGHEFPEVGVWSLGYAASPSKWNRVMGWFSTRSRNAGHSMALPDRALQVLDLMVQRDLGQRPTLFICHSLGGLLAKQVLRKAVDATDPRRNQVASSTRAVLFLATPHAGAELASLVDTFRFLFGATVSIEDLRAHDAHLRDLYDWYRRHAVELDIETVTYYELRGIKGVLPIVSPTSAHPGVGADPVGLDEDHLSIAKPRVPDAQVCGAARDLLRNHVLAPRESAPQQTPSLFSLSAAAPREIVIKLDATAVGGAATHRIPHELPPAAEQFFGRQTELKRVTERLRGGKNTAVVGPAGLGKTALAAEAVRAVVGEAATALSASPFPDGVVFLDLYGFGGLAEPAWNALANRLAGAEFMQRSPARDRATEACRARRILVILEGGEEADGIDGRASFRELCSVLSQENRWLLQTRVSTQAAPALSVELREALCPEDAASLLDSLTRSRATAEVRDRVLALLEGHPLALTWAGNLLARDDEDPAGLVRDWQASQLPKLGDPTQAAHTLEWLFGRSVRGLDDAARRALAAAGLLARAPFPLPAIGAAFLDPGLREDEAARDALKSLVQRGFLRRSGEADHWQFTHVLGYRFARQEIGSDPALRESLGWWLRRRLTAALEANSGDDGPLSLTRALEHGAALLRTDDDQRLWSPLANYVLYHACDRLESLGRLALAKLALSAVAGWLERFAADKAKEPHWLREHSVLLCRQSDVLRFQGDLAAALAASSEARMIARRLAASDPSNAVWQRDLSVSHTKVGHVQCDQGNLAAALASFREALTIGSELAAADPSNQACRRDLSVGHNDVGDVLRARGDLVGALAAYRESLAVRQELAATDPSNAAWSRDLSVSHNKVGDALRAQGHLAGALAEYQESLAIAHGLAAAHPSNVVWQRDLSVYHGKIGDALNAQGDYAGALAAFREDLAITQRLATADPTNAVWQRDLGVDYAKVGGALSAQGDLAEALEAYREALAVRQRLAAADPSNARWQRDLGVGHASVASVLKALDNVAEAAVAYREAQTILQRLAAADPSNSDWQRDLSVTLTEMARFHQQQGNRAEALRFAEESLEIDNRLVALDPTNATWREDAVISRELVDRLRG